MGAIIMGLGKRPVRVIFAGELDIHAPLPLALSNSASQGWANPSRINCTMSSRPGVWVWSCAADRTLAPTMLRWGTLRPRCALCSGRRCERQKRGNSENMCKTDVVVHVPDRSSPVALFS
jgi:hypothetical protein